MSNFIGNEILLAEVTVRIISDRLDYKPGIKQLEIEVIDQNRQKHYITEQLPENNICALFPLVVNTAVNKLSRIIEKFYNK